MSADMIGSKVNFIRQAKDGEVKGIGKVTGYIAPDRELGERIGAFEVQCAKTCLNFEVDERDVWLR